MSRQIDNVKHWRARAEEAHAMANQLTNPEGRRTMLGIAVSYVALAQIAEKRDAKRGRSGGAESCDAPPLETAALPSSAVSRRLHRCGPSVADHRASPVVRRRPDWP